MRSVNKIIKSGKGETMKIFEERLKMMKFFNKDAKLPETNDEIMDWFVKLASDLSPENLCCDGEISMAQARMRARKIMKEWKALEKMYGCEVSEDQAWDWELKRRELR